MKSITTLFRMWIAAWIILTPLLTGVHAQESAGSDPTTINHVTELAYIQDMRNDHNPNLLLLLYAPRIRMYHPFDSMGAIETAEQNARDEMSFQKASCGLTGWKKAISAKPIPCGTSRCCFRKCS